MTGSSDGSTIASEVGGGGGDGALVGTGTGAALRLLRGINAVQQWKGGVIYHDFRKNNKKHLPPRFIVGTWLAGPVLRSRGMVSSMTLATVEIIGEVGVVMGGNVGGERRVQMWSDSDERKMKKNCDRQVSLYIAV